MVTAVTEKRPRGPNIATKSSSVFASASKIKAKIHSEFTTYCYIFFVETIFRNGICQVIT